MADLRSLVARELPHLRDYLITLLGERDRAHDALSATADLILGEPSLHDEALRRPLLVLIRGFHALFPLAALDDGRYRFDGPLNGSGRAACLLLDHLHLSLDDAAFALNETPHVVQSWYAANALGRRPQAGSIDVPSRHSQPLQSDMRQVLIVQPDPIVAMSMSALVERLGYAVSATVHTSTAAEEAFTRNPPHLVLLDLGQRLNLDPQALLTRFKRQAPIVCVTADRQKALNWGADGVLDKPYRQIELQRLIHANLA